MLSSVPGRRLSRSVAARASEAGSSRTPRPLARSSGVRYILSCSIINMALLGGEPGKGLGVYLLDSLGRGGPQHIAVARLRLLGGGHSGWPRSPGLARWHRRIFPVSLTLLRWV